MATHSTRKLLFLVHSDVRNMSTIFILSIILIQLNAGSANNAPTPTPNPSNSVNSIPSDGYSIFKDTGIHGNRSGNDGNPQPGKTAPAPVNQTAEPGVTPTDIGTQFNVGNSSEGRYIPPLDEDCVLMLEKYASLSAEFVYCALLSAKPLLFCETCVHKFAETVMMYRKINEMKKCSDSLLSSDRVQILRETHTFLRRIWNKGSCGNCFRDMDSCEKNMTQCGVTDDVMTFQKYNNQTLKCFAAKTGSGLDVCSNCSAVYKKLNKFYVSMGSIEEVCIDCVEQMNSTRKEWSIRYNCTNPRKDVVSIIAISVFFCSLPLFFYVGSKVHTAKIEYKLMKQNRLSINRPHTQHQQRSTRAKLQRLSEGDESFLTNDST